MNKKATILPVDPIILATTNNGSTYEIQNKEVIVNIFIRTSRDPKKGKRPLGW